jgi:signal peptidase I
MSAEPPRAAGPGTATAPARAAWGSQWLLLLVAALLILLLVRTFLGQSFYVPSASMQPAIEPGDRILVARSGIAGGIRRGDVVVFDGTTTFAAADRAPRPAGGLIATALSAAASGMGIKPGEQDFVKRVVGLPGDQVVCCGRDGRLSVNGVPISESYLPPGESASEVSFNVRVPPGRLWVMGDHRGQSADSRAHLGDPGGGMVPVDDVIGRAVLTYWPPSRAGGFPQPAELGDVPRTEARS